MNTNFNRRSGRRPMTLGPRRRTLEQAYQLASNVKPLEDEYEDFDGKAQFTIEIRWLGEDFFVPSTLNIRSPALRALCSASMDDIRKNDVRVKHPNDALRHSPR